MIHDDDVLIFLKTFIATTLTLFVVVVGVGVGDVCWLSEKIFLLFVYLLFSCSFV